MSDPIQRVDQLPIGLYLLVSEYDLGECFTFNPQIVFDHLRTFEWRAIHIETKTQFYGQDYGDVEVNFVIETGPVTIL